MTRRSADREILSNVGGGSFIKVDYVPGTLFLAHRSVFEQVGLLDEKFFSVECEAGQPKGAKHHDVRRIKLSDAASETACPPSS
jgi:hypothetical protein